MKKKRRSRKVCRKKSVAEMRLRMRKNRLKLKIGIFHRVAFKQALETAQKKIDKFVESLRKVRFDKVTFPIEHSAMYRVARSISQPRLFLTKEQSEIERKFEEVKTLKGYHRPLPMDCLNYLEAVIKAQMREVEPKN